MRKFLYAGAVSASSLFFASAAPAEAPDDVSRTIAADTDRIAGLRSYTFDLHVNILVHTFPAVRFHLDGVGSYERPQHVVIRFTHVPWFGKGFEKIDLAAFDPRSWPSQYAISVARHNGAETELAMRDLKKSALKEARATIDARDGIKQMVWEYDYGGKIQVDVTPQRISGFALPSSEVAEITMPHVHATAHAEFTNYRVVADAADNAP
jgi:hypothetical protein